MRPRGPGIKFDEDTIELSRSKGRIPLRAKRRQLASAKGAGRRPRQISNNGTRRGTDANTNQCIINAASTQSLSSMHHQCITKTSPNAASMNHYQRSLSIINESLPPMLVPHQLLAKGRTDRPPLFFQTYMDTVSSYKNGNKLNKNKKNLRPRPICRHRQNAQAVTLKLRSRVGENTPTTFSRQPQCTTTASPNSSVAELLAKGRTDRPPVYFQTVREHHAR